MGTQHRKELVNLLHQYVDRLPDGDVHRLCNFAAAMLAQKVGKRELRSKRFEAVREHKASLRSNE